MSKNEIPKIEEISVEGERYYTFDRFSEKAGCSAEYVKHCAGGVGKGPDLSSHIVMVGQTPLISEQALSIFN